MDKNKKEFIKNELNEEQLDAVSGGREVLGCKAPRDLDATLANYEARIIANE